MSADRNLLFGILAVQMNFVGRDALVLAMNAWVLDKRKPLGRILADQGQISAERLQLLDALVNEHLKTHNDDPQRSLAALSSAESAKHLLAGIRDIDVQATLIFVGSEFCETTAAAAQPTSTRYQILRQHARGGLGEVFVAQDTELHREVALKEIQLEHADDVHSRGRFVLEAEITGGLEHPGIVPVYGLGTYGDGRPFYAMRFIRGDSLKEAIERFHGSVSRKRQRLEEASGVSSVADASGSPDFGSLQFRQLLRRFTDVCNAIAYAHSRGVLHRDLKPGNVMLGRFGETLVVDWGLAKAQGKNQKETGMVEGDHHQPEALAKAGGETPLMPHSGCAIDETVAGSAIGTPAYMSPEQAAGKLDKLGPASDVYSLGATLYCLLTGHGPVEGSDIGEVLRKVQRGEVGFSQSGALAMGVPVPFVAITRKAMSLHPADRYATPIDLAADIDHWLADEPVTCFREPVPLRARRWLRKHPGITTGVAATVLVGILGLAGGLYFVNAEKNRTELARQGEEKQRIAAERSEERAKTEAATATAVKDFLQDDLLRLASARQQKRVETTGVKMDPDLKVRDLVLRAAQRIEGKFQDQPLVEAEIRLTLGWTLLEIGHADLAIPQFLRVREIRTAKLGPDHPETLASMHSLAISYAVAGRTQEALQLHEETLQLRKAKLGPDDHDTLRSMHDLANTYSDAGRNQEALKLRDETFQLMKAKLGPDHPHTLACMNSLANSYDATGRTREALKLREETLQLRKAALGPDHPDTLMSMHNLANSYADAGRTQDALQLRDKTLQLRKATLGPDHPETLGSMTNLANSYAVVGRTRAALQLREELLLLLKDKFGPDYPDTLRSMYSLADSYAAAGRAQEALLLREETLQLMKARLGPDHHDTLACMMNLAFSYAAAGRNEEALQLHEETLQLKRAKLGLDHPATLMSMHNLAVSYDTAGRASEALKLREETLQLSKAKLGPDHPDTLGRMSGLANSYSDAGRTQEALPLYEETIRLSKVKLGPDHPDTLLTMNNLANCYLMVGRGAEALSLLTETLARRQQRVAAEPGSSWEQTNLAWTHGLMGEAEKTRMDYSAAVQAYAKSVEIFEKLDQAGELKHPFFHGRMNDYRQRLELCRIIDAAVKDLEFALKPPAVDVVAQLLDFRVQALAAKKDLAGVVATAVAYAKLAENHPKQIYNAACAWSLASGLAKTRSHDAAQLVEEYAGKALALLQKIPIGENQFFSTPAALAAHMTKDTDLDSLRDRDDFQNLLSELEMRPPEKDK